MTQTKKHLNNIDILKGMAITLVVIGHFNPPNVHYFFWTWLNHLIYSFHMPLFMIISGYLYAHTSHIQTWQDYRNFLWKKVQRIVVPYFTISLTVIAIKLLAQSWGANLEFPVRSDFWKYLLINPLGGYAIFLWFIYTLFFIFVIYPILQRYIKNTVSLTILCVIIYFLPASHYFCLNFVMRYLLFFHLGVLWFRVYRQEQVLAFYLITTLFWLGLFAISESVPNLAMALVVAVLGSLGFWLLSIIIERRKVISRAFTALGVYSVPIYLLHTTMMGPVKVGLLDFVNLGSLQFLLSSIFAIIFGLALPILITRFVINSSSWLSKLFFGADKIILENRKKDIS